MLTGEVPASRFVGQRATTIKTFQHQNDYVTPGPPQAKEPSAKRQRKRRGVPNSSTAKDPYEDAGSGS